MTHKTMCANDEPLIYNPFAQSNYHSLKPTLWYLILTLGTLTICHKYAMYILSVPSKLQYLPIHSELFEHLSHTNCSFLTIALGYSPLVFNIHSFHPCHCYSNITPFTHIVCYSRTTSCTLYSFCTIPIPLLPCHLTIIPYILLM